MKAVVVGGRARADYLVGLLRRRNDKVVVINNNLEYCEYLSNRHDIDTICGNGTKLHVLEEALIDNFDICISLTDSDADNLAVCQLAQHFFGIRSQVCIVSDPRNVEVFRRLGIGGVVNSTHLLAQAVEETTLSIVESHRQTAKATAYLSFADDEDDSEKAPKPHITSSFHRIGKAR